MPLDPKLVAAVQQIRSLMGYVIACLLLIALVVSMWTGSPIDADLWGAAVRLGQCEPLPVEASATFEGFEPAGSVTGVCVEPDPAEAE